MPASLSRFVVASYALIGVLLFTITTHAAVMQSTNYKIESDSVNMGGGRGVSASYAVESTAGEVTSGISSSASYNLKAGYQQTLVNYISMTAPSNVIMSPTLGGVTGGTANGTAFVTVVTDSAAGYEVSIKASTSPAMRSGSNTIPDYTPATSDPDFTFSVAAGTGEFAFSPEGDDVAARYRDNGASCNTGALDTTFACWDALTTVDRVIAKNTSANHPTGSDLYIRFRTGLGANSGIAAGDYYATTTLTAVSL